MTIVRVVQLLHDELGELMLGKTEHEYAILAQPFFDEDVRNGRYMTQRRLAALRLVFQPFVIVQNRFDVLNLLKDNFSLSMIQKRAGGNVAHRVISVTWRLPPEAT